MKTYRYLFFIIYKRWFKKDRDVGLTTFRTIAELVIYTFVNLGSIVLNSSLWFGTAMPGSGVSRSVLFIGVIPIMIILYLVHHFLLVHGGQREAVLNEFKYLSAKELLPFKLFIVLYFLLSLVVLIGLPWLHNELYEHWK